MRDKQVIIFDFDGTFYSGDDIFSLLPEFVHRHKKCFLPRLSQEQYDVIVKENPSWQEIFVGADLIKHIYIFRKKYPTWDISARDFWRWQNVTREPVVIHDDMTVDPNFLQELCKQYPVYVVSNSAPTHINYFMKRINVNPKWFTKIISNKFTVKDPSKKHYYQSILQRENCKPNNAYVFGDSITSDLDPAKALGINTYHVTDAREIPAVVNSALKRK